MHGLSFNWFQYAQEVFEKVFYFKFLNYLNSI